MATFDHAVEQVIHNLEDILSFGDYLLGQSQSYTPIEGKEPISPKLHQIIRIYFGLSHGIASRSGESAPRIVIADGTSGGKTYTAVAIKALRDLRAGKKGKALVLAPSQVIRSAWLPAEVNHYCKSLNLPSHLATQDVRILKRETLSSALEGDLVLVNYDKFSRSGSDVENRYAEVLRRNSALFDMVILDEAHNLKNPRSVRSRTFRSIIEATRDKPTIIMSASPIPNRLSDAGFLLYLLDPVTFQRYATQRFDYRDDPGAIRNAIVTHPWFYFSRSEVKDLFCLPDLVFEGDEHIIGLGRNGMQTTVYTPLEMSDDLSRQYLEVWRSRTDLGKISRMRQLQMHSKLDAITTIITNRLHQHPGNRVSVFTFLKEGVVDPLLRQLSSQGFSAGVITGEVDVTDRVKIAREFTKGKLEVLISTAQTVGEGIPIITGDKPCTVLLTEPPISPGDYDQIIGRHYRKGQTAPVSIIECVATQSCEAQARMREEKEQLAQEGIRFRPRWQPGTIDEDRVLIRRMKEYAFNRYIRSALPLPGVFQDAVEMAEGQGDERSDGYASLPRKQTVPANFSFMQGINRVRQSIGKPVEDLIASIGMEDLRRAYSSNDWESSSSADTDRMISAIINSLEIREHAWLERLGLAHFTPILDWGCGPACLERVLGRPVVNLDIDTEMLLEGRAKTRNTSCSTPPQDLREGFVQANMRRAPFRDKQFYIVTTTYALQYNAQGFQHCRDIEEILSEENRVLELGGYALFGLPNQATTPQDFETLRDILLPAYGFTPIFADFVKGYACGEHGPVEVFQGAHILVAEKTQDRSRAHLDRERDYQPILIENVSGPDGTDIPLGDIFLFSPLKRIGVGGIVTTACSEHHQRKEHPKLPATEFRTSAGYDIRNLLQTK